jgi:hypothetical protein
MARPDRAPRRKPLKSPGKLPRNRAMGLPGARISPNILFWQYFFLIPEPEPLSAPLF